MLEILDIRRRGIIIVLYYSLNKGADQLCSYCTADLHLCFCQGINQFSHDAAQLLTNETCNKSVKPSLGALPRYDLSR